MSVATSCGVGRTFTCRSCGNPWTTDLPGNFRTCPECKEEAERAKRTKNCAYTACGMEFYDDSLKRSQKYHSTDCRYRAKQERRGTVAEGGFLTDREMQCPECLEDFTPTKGNQVYCSVGCRDVVYGREKEAKRHKTCQRCGEPFHDSSLKGNQRSHPKCSRKAWGHKITPDKEPENSTRTEERRRWRTMTGRGGRYDDISTMTKFTHSWWGKVSEMVFATYRPDAKDMNEAHGSNAPYDFEDIKFGRVDARGTNGRLSPQGRMMWTVSTAGLTESCDHLFVVGYTEDRTAVERLWLIPASDLPASSIRFAPGSAEYSWVGHEVSDLWGTDRASKTLSDATSLPDPIRPGRYDWMDNPAHISGSAPGRKGRRAEILYRERHPRSWDVNLAMGSGAPHDFDEPDGTKVNVKSARRQKKKGRSKHKWAFSLLSVHQVAAGHKCDLYAGLALDEAGERVLREFRIPVSVLGARRLIHIYDPPEGTQWAKYEVRTKAPDLRPDATDEEIKTAVTALMGMPFPAREPPLPDMALAMFKHVRDFPMALGENVIGPWSPKGTSLCSAFFPNRYKACYKGEPSAFEAWHDPKQMKRAVRSQLRSGDPSTPYRVLRALCRQHRTPTVFKPTTARFIYETCCPPGGRVWDPCAGYGGRLLGALAAGVQYVGTDVEPETVKGNLELAATLRMSDRVEVVQERAEVFDPGPVDMVFTSPPYFDRERYSGRGDQSWVKHGNGFDAWVGGFLQPVIEMAFSRLPAGGCLVLNVADLKERKTVIPVVDRTVEVACGAGFAHEATWMMPLAKLNRGRDGSRVGEPILVFRRT